MLLTAEFFLHEIVIHTLDPLHLIDSFQLFGNAITAIQMICPMIKHPDCRPVNLLQMVGQLAAEEQRD